jgi:glycosyltransferase involved in cell wall biosynthesis
MRASVLIPSYRRPDRLARCLQSLCAQTDVPEEVFVIWQGEDVPTRDTARALAGRAPFPLRVLHRPEPGVVGAENAGLDAAQGDLILLIDDDAVAPPDWVARHRSHYDDPSVGAVGGPADNFNPDGSSYPRRKAEPVGRLTWYGRVLGNMYDQPTDWRSRPPRTVDHLVGYNLSLRSFAFDRFEEGLRRYWQLFELDACLQVKARGFRVVFDFANIVEHHPTNTAYTGGRDGDLTVKIDNAVYNQAFILAKVSPAWLGPLRLLYLLLVGSTDRPGVIGFLSALRRYGRPLRELAILWRCCRAAAVTSQRPCPTRAIS